MSTLVIVFGFGALLVLAVLGLLVWGIINTLRARRGGAELANALGWRALSPPPPARPIWFGGRAGERPVAIRTAPVPLPSVHVGDPNITWVLRVVVVPDVRAPLGIDIAYQRGAAADAPFETRFEGVGAARAPAHVREALREFIGTRRLRAPRSQRLAAAQHPIHLRVADRDAVEALVVSRDLFRDAPVLLIHEHPDTRVTPDALQQVIRDLGPVADAVERWAASEPGQG